MIFVQVRKLYKYVSDVFHQVFHRSAEVHADRGRRMLEDPTYSQVVRWGDEGDSFVVLEVLRTIIVGERQDLTLLVE